MTVEPVCIIGVAPEGLAGLSQVTRDMIERAHEIWGSARLLDIVPDHGQKRVPLAKELVAALQSLRQRPPERRIVILASGDPGFYGIAASVLQILPLEQVLIYPQVSVLQAAFARMRIPWQDAALTSAHARPVNEVIGLARRHPKLGILTDPRQNPGWIAGKMLAAGIPDCRAVVIENLGEVDEVITDSLLESIAGMDFKPLNVLLLIHDSGWRPAPFFVARPDAAYRHKSGLITKRDVRLISVSRLEVCESDVIWDIGAGSGAMSIEMAEMAWRGQVFAIEKEPECLDCLRENVARFGSVNVEIVAGEAPQILEALPVPSAVVIGGSGGKLVEILEHIEKMAQKGCRFAANFTLLENLIEGYTWMQAHHWEPELSEARFSYVAPTTGGTRLAPINPVFILSGVIRK